MARTQIKLNEDISDVTLTNPAAGQLLYYDGSKWINATLAANDGWISADETWTYASATTITVPSNATTKYSVGDRIKLTQTTVKYFVIVGVAATTLTITGGTDYTLANAAISANYYSKVATPQGFPQWFNYAPAWTSSGSTNPVIGNGSISGKFCITGSTVQVFAAIAAGSTTTYGDAFFQLSLPVSIAQGSTIGIWRANDAGVANYNGVVINISATVIRFNINAGTYAAPTSPFTMGSGDSYYMDVAYGI